MTQPFIGEIQLFGFNFSPKGWAYCSGATLAIQQNTALFSLLGTQYGGDGRTTFQLPNLSARAGCRQGQGPGLTPRVVGETFGASTVTLTHAEMPGHSHGVSAYSQSAAGSGTGTPVDGGGLSFLAASTTAKTFAAGTPNTQFAPGMLTPSGGSTPHSNEQPYLAMNFCIALQGIFPAFE
ncbi:phage tail protein [Lysobacter cavernae]|uniref:Phage tail protein n=1 Tax=Lysobacter cavernae TaxID=1685901 RepID=A0ABV7RQC0_9GAMM